MYSVQILILIFLVASTAALYEDEYSKDLFHASDVRTFDSIETELFISKSNSWVIYNLFNK